MDVIDKRRKLQTNLEKLRLLQAPFMPNVLQILARRPAVICHDELPEEQPLMFPSDLNADELSACAPGLARLEERLRDGQLHDALDKLRTHLHMKTRLVTFKDRNVRNQVANTRARAKIDLNEIKIKTAARRYRQARAAKSRLAGHGDWEKTWRILNDDDIRTLRGDIHNPTMIPGPSGTLSTILNPESEGRRRTSWIWLSADTSTSAGNGDASMQNGIAFI